MRELVTTALMTCGIGLFAVGLMEGMLYEPARGALTLFGGFGCLILALLISPKEL